MSEDGTQGVATGRAVTDALPRFDARARVIVLSTERYLRMHQRTVAAFTIGAFLIVGVLQLMSGLKWALLFNYSLPIAVCAYSLGLVVGVTVAVAADLLLLVSTLQQGAVIPDFGSLLTLRLFANVIVVAISAGAAAAARARERYDTAQRQLVQTQADLVAAFSHDLRNPLSNIIGYVEVLRSDVSGRARVDVAKALDGILVSARQVDKLVAEMLSAGQDDSAAPLEVTTFAIRTLLADIRQEFPAQPLRDGVVLEWPTEPHGLAMQTDRAKVVSIVRNLLSNALKFTQEGRVQLRICHLPDADAHCIEVEDTGCGIPAEAQPHIFDRFYRVAGTRRTSGFGLGLFIVKRFVELVGGSVTVKSEVGCGTTFRVVVPRLPLTDPEQHPAPAAGAK